MEKLVRKGITEQSEFFDLNIVILLRLNITAGCFAGIKEVEANECITYNRPC